MSAQTSGTEGVFAGENHILPRWWLAFQSHALLPGLIFAKAAVLVRLFTLGIVANINAPLTWGWLGGAQVIGRGIFALALSGIDLACASMLYVAIVRRRPGMGLLMLLGLIVFAGMEVSAIIIETAGVIPLNALDKTVYSWAGTWPSYISPTVVIISCGPAFASIFAGFAQRPPKRMTSAEIAAEAEEKAARIRANALVAQARIDALAQQGKAVRKAMGRPVEVEVTVVEPTAEDPGRTPDADPQDTSAFRLVGKGNIPTYWVDGTEYWSVDSLIAYVKAKSGRIDEDVARRMVIAAAEQELGKAYRLPKIQGQPYGAPRVAVKRAADRWLRSNKPATAAPQPLSA